MRNILGIVFVVISTFSEAAIVCPSMPEAITNINRDVKSEIEASAGRLGRVSAGNVAIRTEVVAKSLFDKFPNVDRSLALQTMAATYCSMLKNSNLTELEILNR